MKIIMSLNHQKNGVELRFSDKPDKATRDDMKSAGFQYSRPQNMWYARQSEETIALAQRLADTMLESQEPAKTTVAEALQSEETGPWMPSYDEVDGVKIYPSAGDVSIWDERSGYFADIPALIKHSSDHVMILNLTNALKPGMTCKRLRISRRSADDYSIITEGMHTFADLYERFFNCRDIPESCEAYEDNEKSMRTFSPFARVAPIKTPEKWTLPHVWKAILSGQAYDGRIDGKYSDDYLYDAVTNFSSGRSMHLPSFAAKLIDSPSGWYVSVDSRDGDRVQLSVNCHSFDMRTLYFDAACTPEEGARRREEMDQAREEANQARLAQRLTAVENDPEHVYSISYLKMDENTELYEVRSAQATGSCIDSEDCTYQGNPIIGQTEVSLVNDGIYQISNFNHRPGRTDDGRFIWLDEWTVYMTGLALKEKLREGYSNESIGEAMKPEVFARELADRCTGRVSIMFGNKVDYAEMSDRYERELERAQKVGVIS